MSILPPLLIDPAYSDEESFARDFDYDLLGQPVSATERFFQDPLHNANKFIKLYSTELTLLAITLPIVVYSAYGLIHIIFSNFQKLKFFAQLSKDIMEIRSEYQKKWPQDNGYLVHDMCAAALYRAYTQLHSVEDDEKGQHLPSNLIDFEAIRFVVDSKYQKASAQERLDIARELEDLASQWVLETVMLPEKEIQKYNYPVSKAPEPSVKGGRLASHSPMPRVPPSSEKRTPSSLDLSDSEGELFTRSEPPRSGKSQSHTPSSIPVPHTQAKWYPVQRLRRYELTRTRRPVVPNLPVKRPTPQRLRDRKSLAAANARRMTQRLSVAWPTAFISDPLPPGDPHQRPPKTVSADRIENTESHRSFSLSNTSEQTPQQSLSEQQEACRDRAKRLVQKSRSVSVKRVCNFRDPRPKNAQNSAVLLSSHQRAEPVPRRSSLYEFSSHRSEMLQSFRTESSGIVLSEDDHLPRQSIDHSEKNLANSTVKVHHFEVSKEFVDNFSSDDDLIEIPPLRKDHDSEQYTK
ncbi:unnamed protein product [Calicophoron daubneyi]|uniref:Uncharacterized protein n=1 Tax=Calicophoron daubneyi TaxID=300641 RepID=A0AAV2TYU1_CALDB